MTEPTSPVDGDPDRRLRLGMVVAVGVAIVVFVFVFALGPLGPMVANIQCDGAVPVWQFAKAYEGGGCAELKPDWHAILPWNDDTRLVCLGMCLEGDFVTWPPPPTPEP